jgi:hypothetical protein
MKPSSPLRTGAFVRLALLLAAAALLGGCPDPFEPGACNSAAECGAGQACLDGLCQDITAVCTGSADCPEGMACDLGTGRCVSAQNGSCALDADCDGTDICLGGVCVPPTTQACAIDTDCDPPDTVCEGGQCVEGCEHRACRSGTCDFATGRCLLEEGCTTDGQCNPPSTICESGECRAGCPTRSCPLETVCDTATGRCGEGCTEDAHCGPPDRICQATECVDGCATAGCPTDYSCNEATGRCTPDEGCTTDAECGPPDLVCDGGECVAGCPTTGCDFEEHCDGTSGRCAAGCVADGDCAPPETVCRDGACVPPSCLTDGCPGSDLCVPDTGLCEAPGTVAFGQSCIGEDDAVDHEACASDFCAPLVDQQGNPNYRCSAACSTTEYCPGGFGCLRVSPRGASLCLLYSQDAPPGTACTANNQCGSGLCHDGECRAICQHDRDCDGGAVCGIVVGDAYMATACIAPLGAQDTGGVCDPAVPPEDGACRRGLCLGSGRCADPCHTSDDCASGYVCNFVRGPGNDWVRACVNAGDPTGTGGVGTDCNPDSHIPCRSLWCNRLEPDSGLGYCIDTCGSQEDCPPGYRCTVVLLDAGDVNLTAPLCLRR